MTTTNEHHEITSGGYELHVIGETGDVEVWLNTQIGDYNGIAIGGGESRAGAVRDAIETLERALGILKEKL